MINRQQSKQKRNSRCGRSFSLYVKRGRSWCKTSRQRALSALSSRFWPFGLDRLDGRRNQCAVHRRILLACNRCNKTTWLIAWHQHHLAMSSSGRLSVCYNTTRVGGRCVGLQTTKSAPCTAVSNPPVILFAYIRGEWRSSPVNRGLEFRFRRYMPS